ncbi:glycosyltransferase family 4 protein [Baekduia soli]|nr:glycosyltransferase family 4 protein [Baekduia soli]
MLAPPWIPVPASGYGGIESVVHQLTEQLAARGHGVTLFAAPGSRSSATVRSLLEHAYPDAIGEPPYEADHVALAMAEIDDARASGAPFDVVHDHSGFTAVAMADRLATPMVHTIHGPFEPRLGGFYGRHGHKAVLVAISPAQRRSAPGDVSISAVVPNPLAVDDWPLVRDKGRHLLWLGRMHETKGPHRAIVAARMADRTLVLAGPVQTGQERFFAEQVEPHIDGSGVHYVGEVGGLAKQRVLSGAAALLMPIRWEEPFGMVMVEALACGTPVIAFPEGAARNIVIDGINGFLVEDEHAMAVAVGRLAEIDPAACRASVHRRYDVDGVTSAYERVYLTALRQAAARSGMREARREALAR